MVVRCYPWIWQYEDQVRIGEEQERVEGYNRSHQEPQSLFCQANRWPAVVQFIACEQIN